MSKFSDKIKSFFPSAVDTDIAPEDKVSIGEMISYGSADLFGGGSATMIALIMLVFFTDILGINAAFAGTVVLVSKLWDAISDPLCGVISDNLRCKFGRRKPFMLIGGALIVPALAFLFAPVQDMAPAAKMAFATIAYITYCTVSTISQVPFMAMASDISKDHRVRNTCNTFKLIFDMIAAGLCYLVPSVALEALKKGTLSQTAFYLIIVLGFGLMFSLPLVIASFKVKERCPIPDEKSRFNLKDWLNSFRVKSYVWHLLMYIAAFLTMDIVSSLAFYYVNNVLRGVMIFGKQISSMYVIAPMMVIAAVAIPACYVIMQKKSKQFAFRVGLPLYITGAIMLAVYQTNWPSWLIPVFAMMMGIGLGGAQSMPWLVFPDTVEVAELKLGYRPTGNFSGVMTFARKLSTAIALQLVGVGLSVSGYKEAVAGQVIEQSPGVLLAIRIMLGVSVTLLISLGIFASLKYKVTDRKLKRIRYLNDKIRVGEEPLTAEEEEEKAALLKELA